MNIYNYFRIFTLFAITIIISSVLSSCIMTKNPQYQSTSSYLDIRYDELLDLYDQKQLAASDVDEAYLLSTVYREKNRLKEAKNLLKIVFDSQKTLSNGVEYISVLEKLGDTKEARNVHQFLTVLYTENEIQTQKRNFEDF